MNVTVIITSFYPPLSINPTLIINPLFFRLCFVFCVYHKTKPKQVHTPGHNNRNNTERMSINYYLTFNEIHKVNNIKRSKVTQNSLPGMAYQKKSDNGPACVSSEFTCFSKKYRFKHSIIIIAPMKQKRGKMFQPLPKY